MVINLDGFFHPKLKPFNFQIKTYYLSGANYPADDPSQKDNPSLVENGQCEVKRLI